MSSNIQQKRTGDFREYLSNGLKDDPELAGEFLKAAIEEGDLDLLLIAVKMIQVEQ